MNIGGLSLRSRLLRQERRNKRRGGEWKEVRKKHHSEKMKEFWKKKIILHSP
jgi:hypothetical protein